MCCLLQACKWFFKAELNSFILDARWILCQQCMEKFSKRLTLVNLRWQWIQYSEFQIFEKLCFGIFGPFRVRSGGRLPPFAPITSPSISIFAAHVSRAEKSGKLNSKPDVPRDRGALASVFYVFPDAPFRKALHREVFGWGIFMYLYWSCLYIKCSCFLLIMFVFQNRYGTKTTVQYPVIPTGYYPVILSELDSHVNGF